MIQARSSRLTRAVRLSDALLLLGIAMAAAPLVVPLSWPRREVIYVSAAGSDWNSGRSEKAAVATIQRAADLATAGTTVLILPGVYREDVRVRRGGEPGFPVVFKALVPGTVTISGSASTEVVERLAWRREGGNLWSAETPWPVYHVVGDDENFYHVRWANGDGDNVYYWKGTSGRVAILRDISNRPGARGAFTYEGGRLYVAFPGGDSPRRHSLSINREVPRPYASWSLRAANVWLEASHVRFEGLRFFLGVGSGILLWNAQDVTVRDCAFSGAVYGIGDFPSAGRIRDLVVERCFYHNYPQGRWLDGWLSGVETYRHHSYSTLVSASGEGIIARYNLITHAGDGMELSAPPSATAGVEIYGNLLAFGTDDAVELDGFAVRIAIHDNVIYDFTVGLGLSPVLQGPVVIHDNIFLSGPQRRAGAHFKLMNPWTGRSSALGGPTRNILATGNLFAGKDACFCDRRAGRIVDVRINRNVFINVQGTDDWPPGVTYADDVSGSDVMAGNTPEAFCRWKASLSRDETSVPAEGGSERVQAPTPSGRPSHRPGPSWLTYGESLATREIPPILQQWLEGCR